MLRYLLALTLLVAASYDQDKPADQSRNKKEPEQARHAFILTGEIPDNPSCRD